MTQLTQNEKTSSPRKNGPNSKPESQSARDLLDIIRSDLSLLERKQSDYSRRTDPWLNFRESAEFANKTRDLNLTHLDVAYILLGLKISRLKNLGQRDPKNEPRADTLQDLRGYSGIIQAMEEEMAASEPPTFGQFDTLDDYLRECHLRQESERAMKTNTTDNNPFDLDEQEVSGQYIRVPIWNWTDTTITEEESLVLSQIALKLNSLATQKGWWREHEFDAYISELASKLLMCHAEVSEAAEELRVVKGTDDLVETRWTPTGKPESFAVELIDTVIRCLDTLADIGVEPGEVLRQKHAYNMTRPPRHGGKNL